MNNANKEWIVFLHGVGGSHSLFYKQIKPFKKQYNLLLIDFPGHGMSDTLHESYSFTKIANEIIQVIDHLKIKKVHVVGISLGTIIMNELCRIAPHRIHSMILGGAVIRWKSWTDILFKLSYAIRHLVPYMFFYKIFALIMMPRKNHTQSRLFFVKDADKLGTKEFLKWVKILIRSKSVHQKLMITSNQVPKLYIMGDEDHIFIDGARYAVNNDPYAEIHVIKNCGHVCNLDNATEFNARSIEFLKNQQKMLDETTA